MWELLKLFDPVAAFWTIAQFAFLGFVLALVLLFVCVKFKAFQRRNKVWNIAVKLYFLYIPLIFMGAGATFGALQYSKDVSNRFVDTFVQFVKPRVVDYLQTLPPETRARAVLDETVRAEVRKNIELQIKGTEMAPYLESVSKALPEQTKDWLSHALVDYVIDQFNKKVAGVIGMDKKEIAKLWEQNILALAEGDFLDNLVRQPIHKIVNGYQKAVLFLLLLLLLPPVADILLAKWLYRHPAGLAGLADGDLKTVGTADGTAGDNRPVDGDL